VCYHCIGLGTVESEVDRQDRLRRVASTLGYIAESAYRKACDSNPEGENYTFRAAENMQPPSEYFQWRVIDRQYEYIQKLEALDRHIQDALLEWYDQPKATPSPNGGVPTSEPDTLKSNGVSSVMVDSTPKLETPNMDDVFGEDDIPF